MKTTAQSVNEQFGPQYPRDTILQKRCRLLQSHYRSDVLKLPFGKGPNRNSVNKYGNMLIQGEVHGKNFLDQEIFEYAKFRCDDKRNVETIDEYRLFNNMLSSQPMCFNLFVPLRSAVRRGKRFVDRVFQKALPQLHIDRIINLQIEYIPVPIDEYINDKTAFDAFVDFRTKDGQRGCIGIETKYVDSLGTNNPKDLNKKLEVGKELGCFTKGGLNQIKTECPQIFRNFLLTEKYRLNYSFSTSYSMVLALQEDAEAHAEIQKLRKVLRPEFRSRIAKISLEEFVAAIRKYCPSDEIAWIDDFQRRYLDMERASELVEYYKGH